MSQATSFARALQRCAETVEVAVPGTPRTLRVDQVVEAGPRRLRAVWSFVDPESYEGDDPVDLRRLREETTFEVPRSGRPEDRAEQWWREIQLAAGLRYKQAIDADWIPGEAPPGPESRSVTELWQALLGWLGRYGTVLSAEPGDVRVRDQHGHVTVYAITPEEWAAYLAPAPRPGPTEPDLRDRSPIVPAAAPLDLGVPLWVSDELFEAQGEVIRIVDGELFGAPLDLD